MQIVLVCDELSKSAMEELGRDFEVRRCDGTNRQELLASVTDVDAIIVRSATKLDAEVIRHANNVAVIARAGVGVDNIDVKVAKRKGITVVNAPDSNIVSVAELTIGMMLSLARHIPQAHQSLVNKKWEKDKFVGIELRNKTVGIIGLGRIGSLVAERLQSFGVNLIAYDIVSENINAQRLGVELVDLDRLLSDSDFVTVHLPKNDGTHNLVNEEVFKKMKPTSFLINVSRGGIVNENDLYNALIVRSIAGAAIDVYETEPCTDSPLFELPNVVVTPHIGASAYEAQENAGLSVVKSMRLAFSDQDVLHTV